MIEIVKWSEIFENSDTRKRKRLGWFLNPSGCDSKGYRRLMKKGVPGVTAFGVFQALAQFSATLPAEMRGRFRHSDGRQMDMEDLADLTRLPVESILQTVEILADVGWIRVVDPPKSGRNLPPTADDLPPTAEKSVNGSESSNCEPSGRNLPPTAGFVKGEGEGEGEGTNPKPLPPEEGAFLTDGETGEEEETAMVILSRAYGRRSLAEWTAKELERAGDLVDRGLLTPDRARRYARFKASRDAAQPTQGAPAGHRARSKLLTMLGSFQGELDKLRAWEKARGINGRKKTPAKAGELDQLAILEAARKRS